MESRWVENEKVGQNMMHWWENVRLSIGSRPSLGDLQNAVERVTRACWGHVCPVVKACPGAIFTGPPIPRQLLLQEQCWYFSLAAWGLEIRACARSTTTQTDPFSWLDG
jgi:hypothetical protein